MRDIKFRAWDGLRMTSSGIMFNCTTYCLETPIGSNMILMQYTGLKDKNGKEIYEGDIIKHPNADEPEDLGWKVIWEGLGFTVVMVRPLVEAKDKQYCNFSLLPTSVYKVIGNIYENPELLK